MNSFVASPDRFPPARDAFRSTLVAFGENVPALLALGQASNWTDPIDQRLRTSFRDMVEETGAQVGLLHRRGEAFFFTVAVHGLERGMHMMVWVSMWDPAIQAALRGHGLVGSADSSVQHSTVARRLEGLQLPRYVLAAPVFVDGRVEGIVELGRLGSDFGSDAERMVIEAMRCETLS